MKLVHNTDQHSTNLLLEFTTYLAIVQGVVNVQSGHCIDLRSHRSCGSHVAFLGLCCLAHDLHGVIDHDGHAIDLTLCIDRLSTESRKQHIGQVLDEFLQCSHQALGTVCWLHVELAQHFLLELGIGHAPSNKLVQVLKSSSVLVLQTIGFCVLFCPGLEVLQVGDERLHIGITTAHCLQQGRVGQLMQQKFWGQTRGCKVRAENVDFFCRTLHRVPTTGSRLRHFQHRIGFGFWSDVANLHGRINHLAQSLEQSQVELTVRQRTVVAVLAVQTLNHTLSSCFLVLFKERNQVFICSNSGFAQSTKSTACWFGCRGFPNHIKFIAFFVRNFFSGLRSNCQFFTIRHRLHIGQVFQSLQ